MKIIPETKLGKLSVFLILLMPILFSFAAFFAKNFYPNKAEDTILADLLKRPLVALSTLSAVVSGILAFATALIAFLKQKEKTLLIYLPLIFGAFLIFLLLGELIFPH